MSPRTYVVGYVFFPIRPRMFLILDAVPSCRMAQSDAAAMGCRVWLRQVGDAHRLTRWAPPGARIVNRFHQNSNALSLLTCSMYVDWDAFQRSRPCTADPPCSSVMGACENPIDHYHGCLDCRYARRNDVCGAGDILQYWAAPDPLLAVSFCFQGTSR